MIRRIFESQKGSRHLMKLPFSPGRLLHVFAACIFGASWCSGSTARGLLPAACCATGAAVQGSRAAHSCCAWWHLNHDQRRWSHLFLVPAAEVEKKKAGFCMWFSFDKDAECSSLILFAILNCSLSGMITEIVSLNIIYSCWILPVYGMQIWSLYVGQDNSSFCC